MINLAPLHRFAMLAPRKSRLVQFFDAWQLAAHRAAVAGSAGKLTYFNQVGTNDPLLIAIDRLSHPRMQFRRSRHLPPTARRTLHVLADVWHREGCLQRHGRWLDVPLVSAIVAIDPQQLPVADQIIERYRGSHVAVQPNWGNAAAKMLPRMMPRGFACLSGRS